MYVPTVGVCSTYVLYVVEIIGFIKKYPFYDCI